MSSLSDFQDPIVVHVKWMEIALKQAKEAYDSGEIPVGAVIVKDQQIIGQGHNQTEGLTDPTAHAEIIAITAAANTLEDWRLDDCIIYVTKEPCPMCTGAIMNARLNMVVFGCYDEAEGCCGSKYDLASDPVFKNPVIIKGGVMEQESLELLQSFFKSKRNS
jgi:tRNA(adenine34) deaminase